MAKKFSKIPSDYSKKNTNPKPQSKPASKAAKPVEFKPKRYSTFLDEDNEGQEERPKAKRPTGAKSSASDLSFTKFKKEDKRTPRTTFGETKRGQVASTYKHAQGPKNFEERPKRKYEPREDKLKGKSKELMPKPNEYKKTNTKQEASEKVVAQMPLNKFLAHCGVCSRREAVEIIKKGFVKVNSLVEVNPAVKVSDADYVMYEGKRMVAQQKMVYYLLNKPKDYITTTDDPEGRKTVLDLFKGIEDRRIFPVGRLDRNTTGLLLLTNDGELAQKLSHPKHNTVKVYQVVLDKPLLKEHFEAIAKGVMLEDGLAMVDELAYTNIKDKTEIGIQIHIGRNRIVRRLFEHFNYQVKALDRVIYAGLTKKNLPRGKWRELSPKEVIYLKHFK